MSLINDDPSWGSLNEYVEKLSLCSMIGEGDNHGGVLGDRLTGSVFVDADVMQAQVGKGLVD